MPDRPDEELPLRFAVKKELRRRMRGLRAALPASAQAARSARVVERVLALEPWSTATAVGLYWPIGRKSELDVRPLFEAARAAGKRTAFPGLNAEGEPVLRYVELAAELEERGQGYLEPAADAPLALPGELGLIVVPALAIDVLGQRIGYGAGFYDRLLPTHAPPAFTVGVVFDFQLISETPATEGDFALAWVATDTRDFAAGGPPPRPAPPAEPPASPGAPTGPGPGQGAASPWSHSRPPPSRAPA
ncbi:MAG: 5-formyltetrahydrofolate cyclo-ligase [Polyangiaceae bacterium]|jgi:5-formyltetrahydrofolate cyclo-ligase|nr:5-formyltetrahydrofolate cyclo-ligase [Polyangiaceae bacterium]